LSKNQFSLSVSIPVYDYSDKFIGVLGADISHQSLATFINRKIGESGFVSLLKNNGILVAVSDHQSDIQPGSDMSSQTNIEALLTGDQKTGEYTYLGKEYLVSTYPIPEINGAVLAQIPVKEAYTVRESVKWLLLRFGIIILVVMSIAIMVIIELYLLKPLMNLSDKMHRIADGDLKVIIQTRRKDEIGDLANTFNKMVKQLRSLISGIHVFCN